jgi:hypothetical protein
MQDNIQHSKNVSIEYAKSSLIIFRYVESNFKRQSWSF